MLVNKKNRAYLYIVPSFIGILLIVVLPIFYCIYISFTNMNMYHWINYRFVGLESYTKVLKGLNGEFYQVLLRTIVWTVINIFLQVAFGIFLAMLLNIKQLKLKGLMRTLLILPWAIPVYISSLIWKGMFNYDFGIVNDLITKIGLHRIEWLTSPTFGMIACIIVNVWLATPFMMTVCLGALQSIDASYYEAADMDGANAFDKFFRITLPLIKSMLIAPIILTSFVTFKQFDIIYLMTGGLGGKTDVVITYAYNKAFTSKNYAFSSAFSVIIFLILLVFTIINMRAVKGGEDI
ncbi:carbohydrate ABC transporter permease [Clostridium oryzae]|uniref:Maltose transport system permease protein MalF n=1 Tax=Clostridium oryzae TaxID=1450648 RepID=A0A1V4IX22_9CLOT|nr:sugar ABC transporter permease [Clostridium oryzae]OPJ64459.1 maltose transport system permease protein MalF [Clostridium oryzae]